MTQIGTVIGVSGDRARVSVIRRSACKGCSAGGCMGCEKSIEADALNPPGAKIGDKVEIGSPSSLILKYSALVFLMPIVLAFVFYYIGYLFFKSGIVPYVFSVVPIVGSFAFFALYLDKKAAKETEFTVLKVLDDESASRKDAESTDR